MKCLGAIVIIGFGVAGVASAQLADVNLVLAGHEALRRGEYLKADILLKKAALKPDGGIRDEGAFGSWDQVHPMLTGEVPVGGLGPVNDPPNPTPEDLAAIRAAKPQDAISEIVRRASTTSIVILNESHDSPRDRAFALQVARALRPLGYRYLAVETFNNASDWGGKLSTADKLERDGFVRRDTGYYTADPVFAGFVREALRLGYHPISYEQTESQGIARPADTIAMREEAEAQNLATWLQIHSGTKMFVYVGYSHVAEAPIGEGEQRDEWMAARLKRKTGIDPLTIDQTSVTDRDPKIAPLYTAAAARIERPSVFTADNRPVVLGRYAGAVDLQVIQPVRSYSYGRPAWLAVFGGKAVPIPAVLMPRNGQRLVQAFAADAPPDAVPLDQVLIEAGRPTPRLVVPNVKLRFEMQVPD